MYKLNNKTLVIASCALALAALAVYLGSVARYSSNVPFWDDFDAVLGFLIGYHDNPGQHWEQLSALHNEHRLLFSRLVVVADYQLNGHVDMLHLIWLGNAGWLACIGMLWLYAQRKGVALAEFAPVIIVMLVFSHRELMVWAMASLQQYFQLAFSIGAILLLTCNRLAPALALFVLSSFTGGGGLLLAPVFGGYHLVNRQWRGLAISSVVILLTAYAYFIGLPYMKPPHHTIVTDPLRIAAYALTFVGSAGRTRGGCYVFAILLIIALISTRRTLFKTMPALGWLAVYIFLTAVVGGVTRAGFGTDMARTSRYTEYSLLLITIAYLGHLSAATQARTRVRFVAIGLAISTALFAYWYAVSRKPMQEHFNNLEKGIPIYPDPDHARGRVKQSCEIGLLAPSVCAKMRP
jgi:hypothetical protein